METINENYTWNTDTTYALGLYKLNAKILGIWPLNCHDVLPRIQVFILCLLQVTMMASLIAEINTECSSMSGVVEVISLISCSILSILKITILSGLPSMLFEVVTSAVEDWSIVKTPSARNLMKKHAKLGRFVFLFQLGSGYVTIIPMILGPLPFLAPQIDVNGTNSTAQLRGLPLRTTCIFGDISDFLYAVVFTIQALQLLSTCTANVGIDVYFFGITMHLCGQFRLLGKDLENFDTSVDESKQRECLVQIIHRHVKLNRLAQHIEDSFNHIILVQLAANALQMSLMGIQMLLSFKSGNTVMIVNTIIILYVMSLQLFLYSYAGDRLSSEIANLRVSAYFSPWHEMPVKLARDVLFIMMRNDKNFYITGGKIYRINIDNFKNLIKALGSYFSVLRIMFDA
uniref:Odorant receptor n=1 Tax=Campoletis chlorideae TaxID=219166 RepID=A0A346D3Y8_9HYME|nr:odorant receptor [Campoletis chlorideae]